MDTSATTSPKLSLKTPVTSSAKRTSPSKTRANLIPQDKGAVILEIGHVYTKFVIVLYTDSQIIVNL